MNSLSNNKLGQVMGITGLSLGVVAFLAAFIPCVGVLAVVPGGAAAACSVIAIVMAKKNEQSASLGIGAFIISLLAVVIAILWVVFYQQVLYLDFFPFAWKF